MVDVSNKAVRFDVATAATKGERDYQEDSLVASFPQGQDAGFAVLADGMGGHMSGDVASALVMSEVFSRVKMKEMLLNKRTTNVPSILYATAAAANNRIIEYITERPESYGMGATLLATVIREDELYWVSVGDSPLYLFRDGVLSQLNQDHSMAPQIDMMVKVGAMTEEVGRNHPDRNTLMSAIAGKQIAKIDCPETPTHLRPNDIVIVASDGLQYLSNDQITDILNATHTQRSLDISSALLAAIEDLADPDQDNTAFTVIKLGACHQATQPVTQDEEPVLFQHRRTLDSMAPTLEAVPTSSTPSSSMSASGHKDDPDGLPTKRVIRLVTSQALSFDTPQDHAGEAAPHGQPKPQDTKRWYRR
jgi:serine/threonine protein phosphatase PrpC